MGYGGTILIPRSPHGEPKIIRLIKSRIIILARHVVSMETPEMHITFWLVNTEKTYYLNDTGVGGRITLKLNLKIYM
jgi:hypothetical protein